MSTFVETCLCRGRGPLGIMTSRHHDRPDLIAALLRERNVARFVVASHGFGKSSLAFEYAQIVFSFQHVFWVKGTSPCFLRDLDAGTFADAIMRVDSQAALVVWDDVPPLNDERAEAFADVLDTLLGHGVESMVTCIPSADRFASLERDRLMLDARELLLSDAEMQTECEAGRLQKQWEGECIDAMRIPCVRWHDGNVRALLARGLQAEELPGDAWLAMLTLLLLEHGTLDDLLPFLPLERAEEAFREIARAYPLFGVDVRTGLFHTLDMDADLVLDAFARRIDALASASLHESRSALCEHVADMLLARGQARRACEFALAASTKKVSAGWLTRRGWRLLAAGEAQPYCDFHHQVMRSASGMQDELSIQRAWAAYMLDDGTLALKYGHRVRLSRTARPAQQMAAQILEMRLGTEAVKTKAAEGLEMGLAAQDAAIHRDADACEHDFLDWTLLGRIVLAFEESVTSALGCWLEGFDWHRSGVDPLGHDTKGERRLSDARKRSLRSALLVAAAWLLDERVNEGDADETEATADRFGFDDVALFVRNCLEEDAAGTHMEWAAIYAGSALERLGSVHARVAAYLPQPTLSMRLHKAEIALFGQQEAYRKSPASQEPARYRYRRAYDEDAPGFAETAAGEGEAPRTREPLMNVRLFGGLEVRIGERLVATEAFSRQKTRMLFELLVLHRGREVSKDRLVALLWPESDEKQGRKSFYSAWSQLRRALGTDEECPYLIRTQTGCRLNRLAVHTDVAEFDQLCRTLLFDTSADEDWERLYTLVRHDFGDDLLACERGNAAIDEMREAFRTQLVDGVVAAANRLAQRGEARGALWFAREAVRRDPHREDVYITLMEAQILADQRGEALDTYFMCRRFLSEELGIDPSTRLVRLYRSVIESEEVLA